MATKQVQLSVEEIRKNKFFIATPCYGGQLNEPYFRSVIKMMTFFNGHQIPLAFGTIANESLVTRARNVLVAYFLASDYTHLLFIDADIEFQTEDILKLYAHKKDVVVGAYPKKGVAWDKIRSNLTDPANKDKNLSDRDMASFGSDYAINFKDTFPTSVEALDFDITSSSVDYFVGIASFKYKLFDIEVL